MGIYKRKLESKRTRKYAFDQESDQEKKKKKKNKRKHTNDQGKKKNTFFSWSVS